MVSTKVALGTLGLACVMAAGGGAYLATRQNAEDAVARTPIADAPPLAAEPAKAAPSVAETEALVGEPNKGQAAKDVPAEAPDPTPAMTPATHGRAAEQRPSRPARPVSAPPRRAPVAPAAQAPAPVPPAPVAAEPTRPAAPPAPEPEPPARAVEPPPPPVEAPPPPPPPRELEELVVSADSVIGLQIENTLSTERARIEDRVDAHVTRDVKAGDRVAIPAGSKVIGAVTLVERGGKVKERARLGVRFHTIVLAGGTRVPVSTTTLIREGDSPSRESTAKIGGAAIGGAILGAILGGGKGAAAGAAAGAAGGTAAVIAGDRNAATLSAGSTVTVRVLSPVTITIEK